MRRRARPARSPPDSRRPCRQTNWSGCVTHTCQRQLERSRPACGCWRARKLSFDEESKALYDAVAPTSRGAFRGRCSASSTKRASRRRPAASTRYDAFRKRFVIPPAKLDAVFRAAIDGVPRAHARSTSTLPAGEHFTVEYVTGKSWSGYNWYQGGFTEPDPGQHGPADLHRSRGRSRLPRRLPGPSRLQRAAREAPGQGSRLDGVLRLSAVLSPQSLIAEGTANFGIEVAFPGAERVRVRARRAVSRWPASIRRRPSAYYEVQALVDGSSYAGNEAARRYLNGEIDAAQAARVAADVRARCRRARPRSASGSSISIAAT